MWARKRIDITIGGLFRALWESVFPKRPSLSRLRIAACFDAEDSFACLSVRSGFDLLLRTVGWPRGSEILFTGLTIGDMPRIATAHGLLVVPVDIDWKSLSPSVDQIESRISSATRAIVVAHLMGGCCDMREISDLARRHNLLLIEDCAQAYTGNHYTGFPQADVSMFSFGSIKTNTALGGAVFFVRTAKLRSTLESNHADWPKQSQFAFSKRILKMGLVKTLSVWPIAALIRRGFRVVGKNHDQMAGGMAKGFAGKSFFKRIRQQPSDALLSFLARRLEKFDAAGIRIRQARGNQLINVISELNEDFMPIGFQAVDPTHWVIAVLVKNPEELVKNLWDLGFDATTRSSLMPVARAIAESQGLTCANTAKDLERFIPETFRICRDMVLLPLDLPMPGREITRLGHAVNKFAQPVSNFHSATVSEARVCLHESSDPAQ